MERTAIIRSLFDTSGQGLEIGPSYNPVVPKANGFKIDIIDHATTADLREKYRNEPGVDVNSIEEIDYIWDGRPLSEVIGKNACYDYIVASHVIEHTPDMLGFMKECQTLLKPTGVLVLAVPDKRRCFDVFRPLSTTGGVLQAHFEKRTRHIPAVAFDHVAYFATLLGHGGWITGTSGELQLEHSLSFAREIFDRSTTSDSYYDFHAWTFCPSSFRLIVKDLHAIGALGLLESQFQITPHHEFFITLGNAAEGCPLSRQQLLVQTQSELSEFPMDLTEITGKIATAATPAA
jgi:SAM-dependent methyltransferase